jgi:hypothetical protein
MRESSISFLKKRLQSRHGVGAKTLSVVHRHIDNSLNRRRDGRSKTTRVSACVSNTGKVYNAPAQPIQETLPQGRHISSSTHCFSSVLKPRPALDELKVAPCTHVSGELLHLQGALFPSYISENLTELAMVQIKRSSSLRYGKDMHISSGE